MSGESDAVIYGWQPQKLRPPFTSVRARGASIWDDSGRRYLDLCAGQINVNAGYGHPHILQAMREQMEKLTYVAPNLATPVRSQLAAEIVKRCPSPLSHVFFTSSGSESIEVAIKI